MALKVAVLCLAVLLGSNALPIEEEEQDMSIFFDHTDSSERIVGGTNADNVPYMVALTTGTVSRSLLCGASIVGPRTMLTAAHCLHAVGGNSPSDSLRGVVGTNRWASGGTQYNFRRAAMHPQYNHNQIKNDIGILHTQDSIVLSASVQRLAISNDFAGAGLATRVTGWGRTQTGGSLSATLLELRPTVLGGDRCITDLARRAQELNIRTPPVDPRIEICTFLAAGRGTCNGDSGSPLVRSDSTQQIGIVSWGLPCARGAPDMFVRVSAYRTWISLNMAYL